jgi:protoporphyrinogen oxidase
VRIAVIGGGLMGLATAHRLIGHGHEVHVFERTEHIGGLATYHDYGPFVWDRFYHVILPTDRHLVGFVRELGLEAQLRWRPTRTGYYVAGRSYSVSTNLEFLTFPVLGIVDKVRLAATILYCSRIEDWRRLEQVTVEDFLVRTSGRSTFEKFWKPLLLAKLGEHYRRVSAVFIWTYIKRLFLARDTTAQREHLGYVQGGYRTILDRLESVLRHSGGSIRQGVTVERLTPAAGGGMSVVVNGTAEQFDKVIFTGPVNALRAATGPELVAAPQSTADVEYLGVICMVLLTRRPLTSYYVMNLADETLPFTGVIGMSTVVDVAETAGLYLTYLPKYVLSTDPLMQAPDEQIRSDFLRGARVLYPDLADEDIHSAHINRAYKVQPLQVLGYSRLVAQPETRCPDFYILNTSQFVNSTLNNNEVVRSVTEFFAGPGRALVS